MATIDYAQFINELKTAHSDLIEILSAKLKNWVTTSGTTTFNLSSGDVTVQNIPDIDNQNFIVKAGEVLTLNKVVKLQNDGSSVAEAIEITHIDDAYAGVVTNGGNTGDSIVVGLRGQYADNFTGLVIGSKYYIQSDFSISTTLSTKLIGIAVSTTKLRLL